MFSYDIGVFVIFRFLLVAYGSWFDHVKSWLNAEDKEHIMHISYEEMIMVRHLTVLWGLGSVQ